MAKYEVRSVAISFELLIIHFIDGSTKVGSARSITRLVQALGPVGHSLTQPRQVIGKQGSFYNHPPLL